MGRVVLTVSIELISSSGSGAALIRTGQEEKFILSVVIEVDDIDEGVDVGEIGTLKDIIGVLINRDDLFGPVDRAAADDEVNAVIIAEARDEDLFYLGAFGGLIVSRYPFTVLLIEDIDTQRVLIDGVDISLVEHHSLVAAVAVNILDDEGREVLTRLRVFQAYSGACSTGQGVIDLFLFDAQFRRSHKGVDTCAERAAGQGAQRSKQGSEFTDIHSKKKRSLFSVGEFDILMFLSDSLVSGADYPVTSEDLLHTVSSPACHSCYSEEWGKELIGDTEHTVDET